MPNNAVTDLSVLSALPHLRRVNFAGNKLTRVLGTCRPWASGATSGAVAKRSYQVCCRCGPSHDAWRLCLSTAFEPEPLDDNFADHEFRVAVGSALDEADLSNNEVEEIDELTQHRYAGVCVPQLPCRHAERHQLAGQGASMCASPHCGIHSCS